MNRFETKLWGFVLVATILGLGLACGHGAVSGIAQNHCLGSNCTLIAPVVVGGPLISKAASAVSTITFALTAIALTVLASRHSFLNQNPSLPISRRLALLQVLIR